MSVKTKKQPNAKHCFVCGVQNTFGIKAKFYEMENGELEAYFTPGDSHQSYPFRMHGGIAASILDEAIGRALQIKSPNEWGITTDLKIKYRKPLPLHTELRAVCRITRDSRMMFEGTGEIYTPDGVVAVAAEGRYMKMSLDNDELQNFLNEEDNWKVYPD
ncbi:MAG: PaaI family thioesterase [Clostridiales bacterium]|nr:PaaI family thioesterase [Clostridiales bacterium]